jgi:hypothetical protein
MRINKLLKVEGGLSTNRQFKYRLGSWLGELMLVGQPMPPLLPELALVKRARTFDAWSMSIVPQWTPNAWRRSVFSFAA